MAERSALCLALEGAKCSGFGFKKDFADKLDHFVLNGSELPRPLFGGER